MANIDPIVTQDHVARLITMAFGMMSNAKPFWCFVAVKPSRFLEMQKLIAAKTFDINLFVGLGMGEVVVSGEGIMPSNDVVKKVAQLFGLTVRELFKDVDADDIIAKEIERVKQELSTH